MCIASKFLEVEQAESRYMRLSRKKESDRRAHAYAELSASRARLLDARVHFSAALNLLRLKRAFIFLEPLAGFLQVYRTFRRFLTGIDLYI